MKRIALLLALTLSCLCCPAHASDAQEGDAERETPGKDSREWAVDLGVAVISDNTTLGIFRQDVRAADGEEGGNIYLLTLSRVLAEMNWAISDLAFRPRLELPMSVGIVDEQGRSPFPQYTAGLIFRWQDFPWNTYLDTTIGVGGGLWYSGKVMAIDRKRHPGEDRSHMKFFLPLELTFSLPRHAEYQLVLFNHHSSGGHVFDDGGIDIWGGALRYRF